MMSATALFIFLSIIVLLTAKRLGQSAMPLTLSLGFWAVLFLFYIITPIQFTAIGVHAFFFMLCCFCLYAAGYYLGINRKFRYHVIAKSSLDGSKADKVFVFLLCMLLLVLYFRIDILKSQVGNITYLINNPHLIREESIHHGFGRSLISYILEQLVLPVSFFILFFMNKSKIRFKIYAFILFTGIVVVQFTTMSRGIIIYSSLMIMTLFIIHNRSNSMYLKRIKTVAIAGSIMLAFLFSINFIRAREGSVGRYTIKATSFRSWVPKKLVESDFLLGTAEILRYINCGIYGFAKYTENGMPQSHYQFGAISLSGGLKLLVPFNIVSQENIFSVRDYELVLNPSFTVVYTFFREQYEDFGLLGTAFLHLLWGFILGSSYRKYLHAPSERGLVVPSTLIVWYIYGAFVMQSVFTIAFTSPFVAYFLLTVTEKWPSKIHYNNIKSQ